MGAVLGYPGGGSLTAGSAAVRAVIEPVGRNIYGDGQVERRIYEVQATIRRGNSGGPFVLADGRVAGVVLVSAVPPLMAQTDDNPEGLPIAVFDAIRDGETANRSQLYRDLADGPFFGHNRRGDVAQGFRDAFWLQSMACGHRAAYECIAAFSATDFRPDLAKFDVPTLVVHGDDDQVVPFEVGGQASAALIEGARLITYPGAPHGITDTHKDQLGADLLAFLKEYDR